jgi:hypothetical protein
MHLPPPHRHPPVGLGHRAHARRARASQDPFCVRLPPCRSLCAQGSDLRKRRCALCEHVSRANDLLIDIAFEINSNAIRALLVRLYTPITAG